MVVMERPGQEIQVIWNQGGAPLRASVPALAATATVARPDGTTSVVRASGGKFTFTLPAATDASFTNPRIYNISSVPLIIVQQLPRGRHVAGLHRLFVEQHSSTS